MRQAVELRLAATARSWSSPRTTSTPPTTRAACSGRTCSPATGWSPTRMGSTSSRTPPRFRTRSRRPTARARASPRGARTTCSRPPPTGGTTSESTPTVGGVMALVLSYGKTAADQGLIDRPLTPDEAVQVVRATASDVTANPQPSDRLAQRSRAATSSTATGAPTSTRRCRRSTTGAIPPVGWIDSPDWYSLYDPTTHPTGAGDRATSPHPAARRPTTGSSSSPRAPSRPTATSSPPARATRRQPVRRQARHDRPVEGPAVVLGRGLRALRDQDARDQRAVHGDASGCG